MLTEREFGQLPPRVEVVERLPLDGIGDVERVMEVGREAPPPKLGPDEVLLGGGQAEPVTLKQLAYAVATEKGITHLAQHLGIGSGKARRLREFGLRFRGELEGVGCELVVGG